MNGSRLRSRLDAYAKAKYGVDPEILPFSREHYEIYRHAGTGKWFAVFSVKERSVLGLPGEGTAEIFSFKVADPLFADLLMSQPGYLRGYPCRNWKWVTAPLDGSVPFGELRKWLDGSWRATKGKAGNLKVPLVKKNGTAEPDHSKR